MKKILATITALSVLSACSVFTTYTTVEYNNFVVEKINASSSAIEETATLYNDTIPDIVTEQDEIEIEEMQTSYSAAKTAIDATEAALKYESRNEEQQIATRISLETYLSAADEYMAAYQVMLDYYEFDEYKEHIAEVETIDENLHTHYTTFIEANNDLVETLEQFVDDTGEESS